MNKEIILVSILGLLLIGCGNKNTNIHNTSKHNNAKVETISENQEIDNYLTNINNNPAIVDTYFADYNKNSNIFSIVFYSDNTLINPYKDTAYFNLTDFLEESKQKISRNVI